MEEELFEKIVKEVKDYSRYLYFHVMGEPLLHPDIGRFLDICHKNACNANITTNGVLIKEAKNKLLSKPALRSMHFSLHSFGENTPDGVIDEYLNEIFSFVSIASKREDFIICFRLWNVKEDEKKGQNRHILKRIEEYFSLSKKIEEAPTTGNGIKLKENIFLSQALCFDWPSMTRPDLDDKGFCLGLRQQAAVLVDGTVVPCCLDSEGTINLGNIKNTSFRDIINGKRAKDLYKGFSERKLVEPLCRKCAYRRRFDV